MPSTFSLVKKLRSNYPQFIFKKTDSFLWSHSEKTIFYTDDIGVDSNNFLFHELSHGLLNHTDYKLDIELITMERKAWDKAKEIAINYDLLIDDDFIQSNLDTYRNWLHMRSTCPKCTATGMQIKKNTYKCLVCDNNWRVNEARTCALRRYKLEK